MQFPSSINRLAIYNASFGTRELGPALLAVLRSVYSKPWLISSVDHLEYDREDILYIIICPAGLGIKETPMPKYYINWQLEFLVGAYNVPAYIDRLRNALDNWDYSQLNIKIAAARDKIIEHHVPPGFIETIPAPDILTGQYIYTDEGKDIDVLFLGYCDAYPRRILIRDNCVRAGLKIWFPSNLDLEGMRQAIRRSKVCINMAAQDMFILAQVRLNILLSNQSCIVSEKSTDAGDDHLYQQSGMLVVPYDKIVETVWDLVRDFEQRRAIAISSYQWYRNSRKWSEIVDWNSLLPQIE
jgi:hypothetical protein